MKKQTLFLLGALGLVGYLYYRNTKKTGSASDTSDSGSGATVIGSETTPALGTVTGVKPDAGGDAGVSNPPVKSDDGSAPVLGINMEPPVSTDNTGVQTPPIFGGAAAQDGVTVQDSGAMPEFGNVIFLQGGVKQGFTKSYTWN